jgi:hypothetical protein
LHHPPTLSASTADAAQSRRDCIIQPGVATTQEWLRRVVETNGHNPERVESINANGDATLSGLMKMSGR